MDHMMWRQESARTVLSLGSVRSWGEARASNDGSDIE
jgi:hypothetical protein